MVRSLLPLIYVLAGIDKLFPEIVIGATLDGIVIFPPLLIASTTVVALAFL